MRGVQDWFDEYGESHRNAVNKAVHWVCVPAIMFAVLGLLWAIPVPESWRATSPYLNVATIVVVAAVAYYVALSKPLALGMAAVAAAMLAMLAWLEQAGLSVWQIAAAIFVVAWIGQFIGHMIEGARPSFFKDVQFLLIGPIWLLAALYRALRVPY
jgi:uncharacterized membrane protein YGL010W